MMHNPERSPAQPVTLPGVTPPERAAYFYVMRGSIRLRVAIFESLDPSPRGTVIIVPGRTEFIEKYFETVEDFRNRGFSVITLDHRGQGLSTRLLADPLKSFVRSFDDYVDDLKFVLAHFNDELPTPHILVGHSMGSTIGLLGVLTGRLNPECAVFNAPMLGIVGIEQPLVPEILGLMSIFGFAQRPLPLQPQSKGLPVPFENNKLTSDRKRFDLWRPYFETFPELRVAGPTYGWLRAAMIAVKEIFSRGSKLQTPTLIVQPSADPIVLPDESKRFAKLSGAQFQMIVGALHESFLEKDIYRNQFFDAFDGFMAQERL